MKTKPTIQQGQTCYLKSGSPMLTVVEVYNNDLKVCWVQYGTGAYHTMTLPAACFHKFQKVAP